MVRAHDRLASFRRVDAALVDTLRRFGLTSCNLERSMVLPGRSKVLHRAAAHDGARRCATWYRTTEGLTVW
jgi:hypothetical protein